jgi:hypothetical protein
MYVTRRDELLPWHFNMPIDQAVHDPRARCTEIAWIRDGFDDSSKPPCRPARRGQTWQGCKPLPAGAPR